MWRSLAGVVSRFLRCATERARMSECRHTEAVRMTRTQSTATTKRSIRKQLLVNAETADWPVLAGVFRFFYGTGNGNTPRGVLVGSQVTHEFLDLTMLGVWLAGGLAGSLGIKHAPVITSATYTPMVRASAFILRRLFHRSLPICLIPYPLPHTLSAEEHWRGWWAAGSFPFLF